MRIAMVEVASLKNAAGQLHMHACSTDIRACAYIRVSYPSICLFLALSLSLSLSRRDDNAENVKFGLFDKLI